MGNLSLRKMTDAKVRQINKKKKFVADGVFHAELHEFLGRALAEAGYGGMEVRSSEAKTDITIKVVKKEEAAGNKDQKCNELESLIQKRFGFEEGHVSINFDPIRNKGLCASAQAEMLKTKLLKGIAVRSAALSIINTVMKFGGAIGCEVIVSGKMRVQRAKVMKYKGGYLISTGNPKEEFIDTAIRHVFFRKGIKKPLPDCVKIHPPKEDQEVDILPQNPQVLATPPPAQQRDLKQSNLSVGIDKLLI